MGRPRARASSNHYHLVRPDRNFPDLLTFSKLQLLRDFKRKVKKRKEKKRKERKERKERKRKEKKRKERKKRSFQTDFKL